LCILFGQLIQVNQDLELPFKIGLRAQSIFQQYSKNNVAQRIGFAPRNRAKQVR